MSKQKTTKVINDHGPSGFVLFMAWIGALVYFVNQANGFWEVVVAFFQACVWPAYVLYYVLGLLGA